MIWIGLREEAIKIDQSARYFIIMLVIYITNQHWSLRSMQIAHFFNHLFPLRCLPERKAEEFSSVDVVVESVGVAATAVLSFTKFIFQ